MVQMSEVTGLDEILRNLDRQVDQVHQGARAGVLAAAIFVQGKAADITPHDRGDLLGSLDHERDPDPTRAIARVLYTADHAPIVHEMPDTTNWSKEGTGNKFLEKAANNHDEILQIIRRRVARSMRRT